MKVFVLGGSGSIGSTVVEVLVQRGHDVVALCRSVEAREKVVALGAEPLAGDLRSSLEWCDVIQRVDAVIHAALTWDADMGDIDRQVVESIMQANENGKTNKPFLYTGGCWLYGTTGDNVATEDSAHDSRLSFDWSVENMRLVLENKNVAGMVIHPAMVFDYAGGVFETFFRDAKETGKIRMVGSESVRWPLIHRKDLAELYALMIEKGSRGDVYNAASVEGMTVGNIARKIADHLDISWQPEIIDVETAVKTLGSWADGYAIDQQMSGQKAMRELGWQPARTDILSH